MTSGQAKPRRSLGQRTLSAAQWQFASSIAQGALQFVVTILLARLLPPAAFGLIALAMIVIGFATLVADLGLGPSLIQHRVLSDRHVRVAFTATTTLGFVITVAIYVAAPYSAWLLRDDALPAVMRVIAFSFLLAGVGSTARALLQRDLNFKGLLVVDVTSYIVGYAGVAVTLALLGWGVWSLVWGALTQSLLATCFAYVTVRHPLKPLFARRELRELLGFGTGASLAAVANYVARNGDNFVVGRYMGAAALGLYGRAYTLMNLPLTYLSGILGKVLFPAFSEIHGEPRRLARAYLMAVQLTAIVAAPLLFGMVVAAPHMIIGLYGEKWAGATLPLQILCAAGVLRAVYHLGGTVAHATGNIFAEFRRQIIYALLVVVASIAGSRWGINGVAGGIVIALIYMYFAMAQLASRFTGVRWGEFLWAQVPGLLLGTGVGTVALAVRMMLEHVGAPSILIFGAIVATCAFAMPCGIYLLPRRMQPTELFGQISSAIVWIPMPIRHSIHRVLRVPI